MVDSPSDALQTHKVSARNSPRSGVGGQKSLKNPENAWAGVGRTGVGDHFGTLPSISIRRDITQTFLVDSPSDNLQIHRVSGRNSPRGGVGGPGRSRAGLPDRFYNNFLGTRRHTSVTIDRTSPKILSQIALVMPYRPTKFRFETRQGAGPVDKKGFKIPKRS